ncbi:MAG: TetR/AcrR family transcriptional regulator [Myxococcota bacterium]|nr:TetR/AcrR family transcriptional regulator [Myxococcales bacterium]
MPRPAASAPSSREKILDVAEALFARSGYAGVGMREVAQHAGLGKSSLFHHFATKPALYFEVVEHVLARIAAGVMPALSRDAGAAGRLAAASDALVDALAEHPTSAPLLLRSLFEAHPFATDAAPPEAAAGDAILAAMIGAFQQLVRDGIATGEFRDVSVVDATQTLIGAAVFHFASGELGEAVLGESLFSAQAVARRRDEQRAFFLRALLRDASGVA